MKDELINFGYITSDREFMGWDYIFNAKSVWFYVEHVLVPTVLKDTYPNGGQITNPLHINTFSGLGHAKILGGIRLRQYRQNSELCTINGFDFICYKSSESKSPMILRYKSDIDNSTIEEATEWKSQLENNEAPVFRAKQNNYPGSGFSVILPLNKTLALHRLLQLKEGNFIDGETRALSIDFSLFNPTYFTNTVCRLFFEFSLGGDVQQNVVIKTSRFLRYQGPNGIFMVIFEVLFIVGVIIYTIYEIYKIYKFGHTKYFSSYGNIADCFVILLYWINITLRIIQFENKNSMSFVSVNKYVSLLYSQYLQQLETYILVANSFSLFLRLFKYFTFSDRFVFLFRMLYKSGSDMLIFLIALFVFIIAFALAGFTLFSSDVEEYRSLTYSIANSIRYLVANMSFQELVKSDRVAGPIFFTIWGVTIVLILANVFIAILSEAYASLQDEIDKETTLKEAFLVETQKLKDRMSGLLGFKKKQQTPISDKARRMLGITSDDEIANNNMVTNNMDIDDGLNQFDNLHSFGSMQKEIRKKRAFRMSVESVIEGDEDTDEKRTKIEKIFLIHQMSTPDHDHDGFSDMGTDEIANDTLNMIKTSDDDDDQCENEEIEEIELEINEEKIKTNKNNKFNRFSLKSVELKKEQSL